MPAPAPAVVLPHIDARLQSAITPDQAQFFRDNGLLVIRNLIAPDELAALRRETQVLVDRAVAGCDDPDFYYKDHELTGQRTPFRVEYVVDKTVAAKALLAHPFILRSVEALQGPSFIPTWDSMVFKSAGQGAAIPWHRDSGTECTDARWPIFNVDIYLDRADFSNCVWGILGSNRWPVQRANATLAELNAPGADFRTSHGAQAITMEPGDVLLHDILALHGSAPALTALRRVIYLEFRPAEVELANGPHRPEYLPLKQQVLAECLRRRAATPYARGETSYAYRPTGAVADYPTGTPPTFRYPHGEWYR